MKRIFARRSFLKTIIGSSAISPAVVWAAGNTQVDAAPFVPGLPSRLKLSLNAYSFNEPLRNGSMTLFDLLEFCAMHNFDAVDLTGYYFPGYPAVPPDEYLYRLKQKAFLLGLDISGTGVKNDFSQPDKSKRRQDIGLIKNWIIAASKLGAPVIRIFSGNNVPEGYTWQQVADWMIPDLQECAAFGEAHGVIVAVQNHNDFIKTATQASAIVKGVHSPWFGLVLDIGSYRGANPLAEIAETAPLAVNWQLKENMYINEVEQKTDIAKVISIIKASGYRGYVPIETLGAGDPKVKVPVFLQEVRAALQQ